VLEIESALFTQPRVFSAVLAQRLTTPVTTANHPTAHKHLITAQPPLTQTSTSTNSTAEMVKFSEADFASAKSTTITHAQRPKRILIPTGQLHLPVAPSSKCLFNGMNDDSNTEPFPTIEDAFDPDHQTESLHCVLHCGETICRRMVFEELEIPPCRCPVDGVEEVAAPASTGYRPALYLDHHTIRSLRDVAVCADMDQKVTIHHDEVFSMLSAPESQASATAMHNHALTAALRAQAPGQARVVALRAAKTFFRDMRLYFSRTLRTYPHREVTIQELRTELDVYLWTMLRNWAYENYYGDDEDVVLDSRGAECLEQDIPGAPGAVLQFWSERVEDVVGAIVGRDEDVWQRRLNGVVTMAMLGIVVLWLLVMLVKRL
jgi:hypothetical protein